MVQLPKWEDHVGHDKLEPLTRDKLHPIRPFLLEYLQSQGDKTTLRVLDFGCGRGDIVANLSMDGWIAFGVDINPEYIAIGQTYLETEGIPASKLKLVSELTFNERFDVVISEQVIEHISDLDVAVAEMASATATAGCGFHVLPSRWSIFEPHYGIPTAHWWPRVIRRFILQISVRIGVGTASFRSYPAVDQVAIIDEFASRTYYRTERTIEKVFMRHGFACDFVTPNRRMVAKRLPRWCQFASRPLAWCVRHFWQTAFTVRKL